MGISKYIPKPIKQLRWRIHNYLKRNEGVGARPYANKAGQLSESLGKRKDLSHKFCSKPWDWFDVVSTGSVGVCCSDWLKKPIGNCLQSNGIMEIWNSPAAQEIRESILDGSFRYCNQEACHFIQNDTLPDKQNINDKRLRRILDESSVIVEDFPQVFGLVYDESCNLRCPSCRQELLYFKEGPKYERALKIHHTIESSLFSKPHDKHVELYVTGSGDPFASLIFREMLYSLNGADFPNLVVHLMTNGVLFTRSNWEKMKKLHHNIGNVIVSFDAATPETYAYTRRGGNWNQLLKNFEFMNELRKSGFIRNLEMNFVIQQKNYREMADFVKLGQKYGNVDTVGFTLITNWGTYSPKEFSHHAIWRKDHPEFNDFLNVLKDPIFDDPIVDLKNVKEYRTST